MFERFLTTYAARPTDRGAPTLPEDLTVEGYGELMSRFAGATFEQGLYRLHDADSVVRDQAAADEAHPAFAGRAHCFGFDWLGRQFAVDRQRRRGAEPLVLMLEPGTGEVLEVPTTFADFHDEELVAFADAALAADFFIQWAATADGVLPLRHSDCAGYRVPLFLGGADSVENLEIIDMGVYWSLCGQLRRGTKELPVGATIRQLTME
jgi:hypothetical protein